MLARQALLFFFLFIYGISWSQDLHFSQYFASPLHLNPGMTGVFDFDFKDKDLRFSSIYRQQWRTIQGPYISQATPFNSYIISGDGLIKHSKTMNGDYIGIGAVMYYDNSGDLRYSTQFSGLNIAYAKSLNQESNSYLTLGFQYAFAKNSVDFSKGVFDNQWTGIAFDPTLPTGETFPKNNFTYSDVSVGVTYSTFGSAKYKHTTGIALFHLNNPDQNFFDQNESRLPKKFVFHYQGQYKLRFHKELIPISFFHTQANAYEFTNGVLLKIHLRGENYQGFKNIQFGGAYRLVGNHEIITGSDALILYFRTRYQNFLFGLSYDSNFSGLTTATRTIGAFEISIVYYRDLYKSEHKPRRKHRDYEPVCPDE